MSTIHQRVRAAQEKRERDAKRVADAARTTVTNAQIRADVRREARIDALIEGTVEPRNAEELAIVMRVEFEFDS